MKAVEQELDGLATELAGEKSVEQDRTSAALGMANFPGEDGSVGTLVAALPREERIADALDQEAFERLPCAGVLDVARSLPYG